MNLDALLNAGTVFNDGADDVLTGNAGLDWFWAGPAEDNLIDFGAGEQLN